MKRTPNMQDLLTTEIAATASRDHVRQLSTSPKRSKTPSAELTITVLTELLTDFETQCDGTFHTLTLARYIDNVFHLTYRYHDGNLYVQRTMPLTMQDTISVRARHDKIMQFFQRS